MSGKEMRAKRKLLGLTAEELANRVGVTKQTIINIERGNVNSIPTAKVMEYELARAFIETPSITFLKNLTGIL